MKATRIPEIFSGSTTRDGLHGDKMIAPVPERDTCEDEPEEATAAAAPDGEEPGEEDNGTAGE